MGKQPCYAWSRFVDDRTTAEKYALDVYDGKIVACKKLVQLCDMLLPRFEDSYKQWHYDRARARRPVDFIEKFCCVPSGRKFGKPMSLEPYEKFVIEVAFGFVDDEEMRQFNEVLWWVAKKCGKTSMIAAIAHYMMTSDGEGKPEIYCIASAEPQAGLCYGGIDTMRRQSPSLAKWERTGEVKDRKKQGIICDKTNGYVVTLSGSPKSLDGPNPHLVIADEIAAWDDRGPYDQMRLALTRSQPMMWELTTANFVRNSIGDAQYDYAKRILDGEIEDDRFLPVIYEQDEPDEWLKPETWLKSNPGLGTVKPLDKLEPLVKKAKADPAQRPAVLVKHFNIPQNQSTSWLTYAECGSDRQVDMSTIGLKYGIAGFDASDSIDLSAAQFLFMRGERYEDGTLVDDTIYERSMYWIPEEQLIPREDAGFTKERDGVPYRLWESQGLLKVVPGNHIPKSVFLEWLQELRKEKLFCFACGFDPWHMDDSTVKNLELFVGESRIRKVRQGAQTLSDPMKRLKADYARGRFVDNGHPINRWCRMNVQVKTDVNQNIQPDKRNNNPANRIDGFMAELDAYVTLLDYYDEYIQMVTSTWKG